jgi:hypothetical protein
MMFGAVILYANLAGTLTEKTRFSVVSPRTSGVLEVVTCWGVTDGEKSDEEVVYWYAVTRVKGTRRMDTRLRTIFMRDVTGLFDIGEYS